jgi:hypothetical protein
MRYYSKHLLQSFIRTKYKTGWVIYKMNHDWRNNTERVMIDRGYSGIFININELDTASSSAPVYVLWILFIRHHSVRFTLSHCKHVCSVVACPGLPSQVRRQLAATIDFCKFLFILFITTNPLFFSKTIAKSWKK